VDEETREANFSGGVEGERQSFSTRTESSLVVSTKSSDEGKKVTSSIRIGCRK
jgi:hypothetical protein